MAPADPSGADRSVAAQAQQQTQAATGRVNSAYDAAPQQAPTLDVYA